MKNILYDLIIFGGLSLIAFIIDINNNICIKNKYNHISIYIWLYLHHLLNIFANFGFISQNKTVLLFYLFTPIIATIHWMSNNNKCILTQIVNNICNDNNEFRDFWELLGIKKLTNYKYYHYTFIFFGWCIGLYRYITKI
jgi:hypothetical protein